MSDPVDAVVGRGPIGALDAALGYLRDHVRWLAPVYVLAMAPMGVAMLWLTDAVAAGDRAALRSGCVAMTAALVWRWPWLAVLQRRVQGDLRGDAPLPVRARWVSIVVTRLIAFTAVTWGGVVIFPAYWGLFLSGFAAPALLEEPGPAVGRVIGALGTITRGSTALGRAAVQVSLLSVVLVLGVLATQYATAGFIAPMMLGIEPTDVLLTMSGLAWWMTLGFAVFCVLDLYWHVAAVMLWYHLAARRLGPDLQRRLAELEGATA